MPQEDQARVRGIGLSLAMIIRILLLLRISRLIGFNTPFFSVFGIEFSGQGLILLAGGLFLLGNSTLEIHHKVEGI